MLQENCISPFSKEKLPNGVILASPIVSDRLHTILPQTWPLLTTLVPGDGID